MTRDANARSAELKVRPGSYRTGAPNRSRTCDLALRRGALYPTELPGLRAGVYPLAPGVRTRFSAGARLRGLRYGDEALGMEIGVAEGQVDGGQALEIMADDEFVRHAHAAMDLDGVLADVAACLADDDFGGR